MDQGRQADILARTRRHRSVQPRIESARRDADQPAQDTYRKLGLVCLQRSEALFGLGVLPTGSSPIPISPSIVRETYARMAKSGSYVGT